MIYLAITYLIGVLSVAYVMSNLYKPGMRVRFTLSQLVVIVATSPFVTLKLLGQGADFIGSVALDYLLGLTVSKREG